MRATFSDPALQGEFEREGYVTTPLLSKDEVGGLRSAFKKVGPAPGDPYLACHSSFHTYDADYKREVDSIVRSVLGPHLDVVLDRQRPLPCNFIAKWPGGMSGFGLHQDLSLVDERSYRSAEVWVALDDTDEKNGQLWMVPRSHTWLPTLRGIAAFPFAFANVTDRIINRHSVPVPVRAGEAVIFNHATLHFSMPNRTAEPRLVAITDVIPEEAMNLHYFGDGRGSVAGYAIDDAFWTDNNPFTLDQPPGGGSGWPVQFGYREMDDETLDRLVAEGQAIQSSQRPVGAINSAQTWCHRCGKTGFSADKPNRSIGNVTLLCADCSEEESARRVGRTPAGNPA